MGLFDKIRQIFPRGEDSKSEASENGRSSAIVGPSLHLVVDGEISIFPLASTPLCTVGRDPDNAIVIPPTDREASRKHASVQRLAGDRYVLTDLRSRNGTKVNGMRIEEKVLENGDRISIGCCELVYHSPDAHSAEAILTPNAELTTMLFKERLVTVLAVDIRDSVAWAKELRDDQWAELVMKLIDIAGAMLNRRHCAGQKYIGDAIMAVWEHQENCISNAEFGEILSAVGDLREIFTKIGKGANLPRPILFGCGINSGYAAIGYMAGQVALGDTVNKAFRLESVAKDLSCDVVISQSTINYLKRPPTSADLPEQRAIQVKGFTEPEAVYVFQFDQVPELADQVLADD